MVTVCGIGGTYLGMALAAAWCVQMAVSWSSEDLWLAVFPLNCILLAVERIRILMAQWQEIQAEGHVAYRNRFLQACNDRLMDSAFWPVAGVLAMLPMLGLLIAILALFGQSPDSAVVAFTQTSDWRLSAQVSPPNIPMDGHYLCTVAAGGHRRVVKPLRRGLRHGHPVTVNRQLCVANAFEQILEERTPHLHRTVRGFYDNHGLPVARLIRSPYAADAVYFLMKPLEWIFLIVIYFYDVKPENRIAMQYIK